MVSIIIPTFNRFHLIGATLDSIFVQSYNNWECIVVDDGSTDYTTDILDFYCKKDNRLKYYKRPSNYPKGANSCRNYGLKQSSGDYIQFFDSDDLMNADFLIKKVKALDNYKGDYVLSKSVNFKDPDTQKILDKNETYYRFENYPITHFNYVSQNINWLTPDFMGRRGLVEKVIFNERLDAAQERNYFSKVTALSTNAIILDEYLTYRRIHDNSTQFKLRKSSKDHKRSYFEYCYETYFDLKITGSVEVQNFLLNECIEYSMFQKIKLGKITNLFLEYFKENKGASIWFIIYQLAIKTIGKGHFFRKMFRKAQQSNFYNVPFEYRKEIKFNVLTRTSGRPNGFKELRKSIAIQNYKNIRHLVSYDSNEDLDYLRKYDCETIKVSPIENEEADPQDFKPYNLYCNKLLEEVKEGWILILDDDNKLKHKNTLRLLEKEISGIDEDTILFFQTSYPDGSKIPEDAFFTKKQIEKYHIDTACVVFHSKYKNTVKWDAWRTADYRFINKLSQVIPNQNWIKRSLTQKFNFGDLGRRNDIY